MADHLEHLAPPSARTVSHSMRFEPNRHDTTSCTGLTVTTDRLCAYCISPCRQDRSSLRIESRALPSGRSVMTRCPAPASTSRRLSLRILYLALPSRRTVSYLLRFKTNRQ